MNYGLAMDATSLDTRQKIKGQIVYVSYSSKEENIAKSMTVHSLRNDTRIKNGHEC